MNRSWLVCLSLVLGTTSVFGTAQLPDLLVSGGKEQSLHSNPLEPYFAQHPDKRPKTSGMCSALWRGYVATFEIVEGELRVKSVKVLGDFPEKSLAESFVDVTRTVFPSSAEKRMDWFTGFLVLPQGKVTRPIHMGYASEYEGYRLLYVHRGRLAADRVFMHEEYGEYKRLQFEAFSRTERFQQMKASLEKSGRGTLDVDSFLYLLDVDFPMETLIDYKDFRPSKALAPVGKGKR